MNTMIETRDLGRHTNRHLAKRKPFTRTLC